MVLTTRPLGSLLECLDFNVSQQDSHDQRIQTNGLVAQTPKHSQNPASKHSIDVRFPHYRYVFYVTYCCIRLYLVLHPQLIWPQVLCVPQNLKSVTPSPLSFWNACERSHTQVHKTRGRKLKWRIILWNLLSESQVSVLLLLYVRVWVSACLGSASRCVVLGVWAVIHRVQMTEEMHRQRPALVILDLDHTLVQCIPEHQASQIHSTWAELESFAFSAEHKNKLLSFKVFVRPHARSLIEYLANNAGWVDVRIASVAEATYVHAVQNSLRIHSITTHSGSDFQGKWIRNLWSSKLTFFFNYFHTGVPKRFALMSGFDVRRYKRVVILDDDCLNFQIDLLDLNLPARLISSPFDVFQPRVIISLFFLT